MKVRGINLSGSTEVFLYVVLLILFLGISHFDATSSADKLRREINAFAVAQCPGNLATIAKYNDSIDAQIETYQAALALNQARGDKERAAINAHAIARLSGDKLPINLIRASCNKPVLP